jgi:hypothetical protein
LRPFESGGDTAGFWDSQWPTDGGAVGSGADLVPSGRPGLLTMRNPAAVYCLDLGYSYTIVDQLDGGQAGACTLPDGTVCDAWDFLGGTCGPKFTICGLQGLKTVVRDDGRDPFLLHYAACFDAAAKTLQSVTDMMDLARKVGGNPMLMDASLPAEPPVQGAEESRVGAAADLPGSFDWRDYAGGDWTTPIKNQGMCGSCWAFAAVGVAEAAHNIAAGNPDLDPNLAEQYLVADCATSAGACDGGNHGVALDYIKDYGIPDEDCFPYHDGEPGGCSFGGSGCDTDLCTYHEDPECSDYRCTDRCSDWESRLSSIETRGALYGPSKDAMKDALIAHGPLAVALNMDGSFNQDGIYVCTSTYHTHGVSIVGYDDAGEYWIVKNSWGSSWGPDGDGFFKVAYDHCGIQAHAYYADAGAGTEVGPLAYAGHYVDDDSYYQSSGNNDGVVDCGEAIELYVDLHNHGGATASTVNATIATADPYVTFTYNTDSSYPDIPAGASRTNSNDFDFQVAPDAPDGHVIQFDLDITASNGGPWSDTFDVSVNCAAPSGISVFVENQASQPAVNAYVQVYSDTAFHAGYTGYTDGSGHVAFPDVPDGVYTAVVTSWTDHFLLLEENVQAPATLSLDTSGTAQVDVSTYGLGGSSPTEAGILFAPFFTARPDVGWTDTGGHLQVNVTPYTYSVIAASFIEPYFLVKPGTTVAGAMQVDFDPTQMTTGELTPDLLDFSTVRVGSWGSHSAWSWNFTLADAETMTFSPDTYNLDPDLIKLGGDAEWYYTLDGSYAAYEVTAGLTEALEAGGSFDARTAPGSSFYDPGDDVNVENLITDAFANRLVWIENDTLVAGASDAEDSEAVVTQGGAAGPEQGLTLVTEGQRAIGDVSAACPGLTVQGPGGQSVVDDSTCDVWSSDYQFTLSTGADDGIYTATLSVDTGPHQGTIGGQAHFVVGCVVGDVDSDGSVGVADVQAVSARWRTSFANPDPDGDPGTPNYDPLYDLDNDGLITIVDIMQVVSHWGETSS